MDEYHVFMDETGTKELSDTNQNLYGICAVLIDFNNLDEYETIIKKRLFDFFGEQIPELKSNWMRIPKERTQHYLEPYDKTEEDFKTFSSGLYEDIRKFTNLWVICSVINKEYLKINYKNPYNPNPMAYELLVQRIANFSTQYSCKVKIFYDEFTEGKTVAGNKWQDLLIRQHKLLRTGKTSLNKHWTKRDKMDFSALPEEIVFVDSADSLFVQIADLCAYNIRRQVSKFYDNKAGMYWGYEQIKPRIHLDFKSRKIKDYGIVFFPENKKPSPFK